MDSLAGSLPRQQQEPPVSPPIAAGASSSRTHTGREASVGAATRPDATLYRAPQPRQTKSSRDAAERNRRGSKAPPPGSASMSASQVQALLARLDDLESREAARTAAEEELKTVNVALMDRLTAFRAVNDENVAQAEAELSALGEALAHAQRERAEATAAADEARAEVREAQRAAEAAERAEAAARREQLAQQARAEAAADQLARTLLLQRSAEGQSHAVGELACRSLRRKYLLLLRYRTARQRALRSALRPAASRELAAPAVRARLLSSHLAAWRTALRMAASERRVLRRNAKSAVGFWRAWSAAGRAGRVARAQRASAGLRAAVGALRAEAAAAHAVAALTARVARRKRRKRLRGALRALSLIHI